MIKKLIKEIKTFLVFRKKYIEMDGGLYYKLGDSRYIKISL